MSRALILPREHGAWAMLLFPFVGSLIVAKSFRLESVAALVTILGVFLSQEAVLVLFRQRYVWKDRRAVADLAPRSLTLAGIPIVASGVFLLLRVPSQPLVLLGLGGFLLLVLRMVLAVGNLQRSAPLQIVEAMGLSATALVGYLSARGELDRTAFVLWGAFSLHHAAALFVIRARLEAISTMKTQESPRRGFRRMAWAGQILLLAAALGMILTGRILLAVAFAIPLVLHTKDLLRLSDPSFVKTPLTRVGWREVTISTGFAASAILALTL